MCCQFFLAAVPRVATVGKRQRATKLCVPVFDSYNTFSPFSGDALEVDIMEKHHQCNIIENKETPPCGHFSNVLLNFHVRECLFLLPKIKKPCIGLGSCEKAPESDLRNK